MFKNDFFPFDFFFLALSESFCSGQLNRCMTQRSCFLVSICLLLLLQLQLHWFSLKLVKPQAFFSIISQNLFLHHLYLFLFSFAYQALICLLIVSILFLVALHYNTDFILVFVNVFNLSEIFLHISYNVFIPFCYCFPWDVCLGL